MLKITTTCGRSRGVECARLEGRLAGDTLPEFERWLAGALGGAGRVALDLSGVTFLDAEGARRLRGLADRGVEMRGPTAFVAQLLGRP